MDEPIADKWNTRYAYSGNAVPAPAEVLSRGVQWLPTIADRENDNAREPLALDLACGRAGNAQYLATKGYAVTAWDISETVIAEIKARKPAIIKEAQVRDVSLTPPVADSFDVIVVSRFLDRSICPAIADALKPDGVLFYQTFVHGLRNPDYLLAPNELLSLFSSLHVLEYHEPAKDASGRVEARLVARRIV